MDQACLQYSLTPEERSLFEEQGYLILEDALSAEHVDRLLHAVDQCVEERAARGIDVSKRQFITGFIPKHEEFVKLLDYEKIFPKVWGLLGFNIYVYHAHVITTPPSGKSKDDEPFTWHQDGGRMNLDIPSSFVPRPGLELKVAYFLTDTRRDDCGHFWIIPGSHLHNEIPAPASGGQPEGAIPLRVKPGTAVIFDRRLWHAGATNFTTDYTRKAVFYGYSFRWLQPKDELEGHESLWNQVDPIKRQLLGYCTSNDGKYTPKLQDVPLLEWMQEFCPEQVVNGDNRTGELYVKQFRSKDGGAA